MVASSSSSSSSSTSCSAAPTYFAEPRHGEVAELHRLLGNPRLPSATRRGVIEHVIAYMTLGIDVSRLFTDMIMATNTKDVALKKMIYFYLANYAEQKQELALLVINTLQKDCRDDDPMVRGLALRSLCSLRVPKLVEYIVLPIRKGINDPSSYVRKAAIIGCAKLFALDPLIVQESDIVDLLYDSLRDNDSQVVHNVINTLNDILRDEGGMVTNKSIIMHLLNRIRDFDEWSQCTILALVATYTPDSDNEVFDIMNLLEGRLKHSNSAVVLGAIKVFLNFTKNMTAVHHEVLVRIKGPLLTFVGGGAYHISFTVLSHIRLLVARAPTLFCDEYRAFFLRYNDPSYIKILKLDLLDAVAAPQSASEILGELSEYVTDDNVNVARKTIRTMGSLAVNIEEAADDAIEHLLSFVELHIDYVSTEAFVALKNILRKYPERYEEVVPLLQKTLRIHGARAGEDESDEEGRVAILWMIGEYGDVIDEAPYVLEQILDAFEKEKAARVRCEMLITAMKLFFKRPPEMQRMLGRVLHSALQDLQHMQVRDRAILYYRLLQHDVHEAARIVNCPKIVVDTFAESDNTVFDHRLFSEFNSLSIIYAKHSSEFDHRDIIELTEVSNEPHEANIEQDDNTEDILNCIASPISTSSQFSLNSSAVCEPAMFQEQWSALPAATILKRQLHHDPTIVEQRLNERCFFTLASGILENQLKIYVFAQPQSSSCLCFIECIADIHSGEMTLTLKCDDTSVCDNVIPIVDSALQELS